MSKTTNWLQYVCPSVINSDGTISDEVVKFSGGTRDGRPKSYMSKLHFARPMFVKMVIDGNSTQVEIAEQIRLACDGRGISYGQKHISDPEHVITETVGKATRPISLIDDNKGHYKNIWGINAANGPDGKFSNANYVAKYGDHYRDIHKTNDYYVGLSKLHTANTAEHGAYSNRTLKKGGATWHGHATDKEIRIPKELEEAAGLYPEGVKRQTRVQLQSKSVQDQLRKGGEDIVVKQEHNKLQNKLYEKLYNSKSETDTVEMEANYIDIKVENDKQVTLYEVKLGRPIRCIKEGLGQLLSYIYSFEDDTRKKKIIIAGKYAPDEEEKTFINFIKKTLQIDFEYRQCS